jgi:hypothetical protein
MTEKEKHEYFGFDRFLQVVDTKYENELLELEKKYYNKEINDKELNNLWNKLVEKILNEK